MIDDRNTKFLKLAKSVAEKATGVKRQFGAVIVDVNKIKALGKNRMSHPKIPQIVSQTTGKRYWGLHAEISALLKCDFSVRGMAIYVHGQNLRSGRNVYSKPCELCAMFLKRRGIEKAVFSTQAGYEVVSYFE